MRILFRFAFCLLVGNAAVCAQNLITNGGFEAPVRGADTTLAATDTSVTGWTAVKGDNAQAGTYIHINGGGNTWIPDTPFGTQTIQLDTLGGGGTFTVGSSVSQTLTLPKAGTYRLSFAMNSETTGSAAQNTTVNVNVTGATTAATSFTLAQAGTSANWVTQLFDFTSASGGSITLKFSDVSSSDRNSALDNVQLFPVPEVGASLAIYGSLALAGVAMFISRKSVLV
jgi:hypothetical protein